MDNILVEIIVRKNDKDILDKIPKNLLSYLVYESNDKIVYNVPTDWIGFKDGTINNFLKEFGEYVYVAIAYFSSSENEIITDFDGVLLNQYCSTINGKKVNKCVKKKIQIVKILDDVDNIFEVTRYILDLKFVQPVIKVLDLYSDENNGGVKLKEFVR